MKNIIYDKKSNYGIWSSCRGSSRNSGMAEKKPQLSSLKN